MKYTGYSEYLHLHGEDFFTMVLSPKKEGKFPAVICRSPYVSTAKDESEEILVREALDTFDIWLQRGYTVVYQHCRGRGKSSGSFIPYIHEREDGLALRRWVREQPFYNGEIFLWGSSYTASLHYATAPFEEDIKGAVFEVQDSDRYRLWYRNGQMRKGHANWHFNLYKSKCGLNKCFNIHSFSQLPLKSLSETALGERAEDFEQMLTAQSPTDAFWNTRPGGCDTKGVTDLAGIPILLTTGYNDFYVGGIFDMWSRMCEATKKNCALLVSPYDHGDRYRTDSGLAFPGASRSERFGRAYPIDWFDHIRKGTPLPYPKGVITYYRTFENKWGSDFSFPPTEAVKIPLGSDIRTFCYDPLHPPAFSGEGSFAEARSYETDTLTLHTPPFPEDIFIKGKMRAVLTVESDCPDSSFYMRISIRKAVGTYVLRHDILSLDCALGDYKPNTQAEVEFCFDEYAFLIQKGEHLQIDIAGTDDNTYVCHTNRKGNYYAQTGADTAINKVYLARSSLILPVEKSQK